MVSLYGPWILNGKLNIFFTFLFKKEKCSCILIAASTNKLGCSGCLSLLKRHYPYVFQLFAEYLDSISGLRAFTFYFEY